ncbi:uncharacterized protein KQ657_003136 [Scheffersomyces spartinae]|uniref:Sfi1 spindle body domain-containing protein n=1 Tax=Scheffersomyces spartinae TaxID=45513 RepID=A0A9P7V5D5_9ASCO|nr:uncharacterized protein KQ657_003136 [Scheffersomyces spartinae]KAG7191460.1 hypothetical protein KQ657_003136 [Scheffersomyces spartinae]
MSEIESRDILNLYNTTDLGSDHRDDVKFLSTDPELNRLFKIVVNVIMNNNNIVDMSQVAQVLWDSYVKVQHVVNYQVLNFVFHERKLALFNRFFLQPDLNGWRLLPSEYDQVSSIVLSAYSFLPFGIVQPVAVKHEVQSDTPPVSAISTTSMLSLSRPDRGELIARLRELVPILKDYNIIILESFPSVLKYYFDLVYEQVFEWLLVDDYKYITDLLRVVNQIVDFNNEDTSTAIPKDDILVLVKELVGLQKMLMMWDPPDTRSTITMRLARYEWFKSTQCREKFFKTWNNSLLKVCNLDILCTEEFMTRLKVAKLRYWLGVWYGKTIRFDRLSLEVRGYYQQKLLVRYFVGRVIGKVEELVLKDEVADNFRLKKYMKRWRTRINSINDKENNAIATFNFHLMQKYFDIIYVKASQTQKKLQLLREKEQAFTVRYYKELKDKALKLWLAKLASNIVPETEDPSCIGKKLSQLTITESNYILNKFWYAWKQQHSLHRSYSTVVRLREASILRYAFSLWHLKSSMVRESETFRFHQDLASAKFALKYWKQQKDLRVMARGFYEKKSRSKWFKIWEKSHIMSDKKRTFQLELETARLVQVFKMWRLEMKLQVQLKSTRNSQNYWLKLWKAKLYEIQLQKEKANSIYNAKIITFSTNLWHSKERKLQILASTADNIVKRRVLLRLQTKISNLKEVEALVRGSSSRDYDLWMTLKCCFVIWYQKYLKNRERMAEFKIRQFDVEYVVPNLLRKTLTTWVGRYNDSLRTKEHLNAICNNYLSSHPMRRDYFEKWLSLMVVNAEFNDKALEFEKVVVLRRFLLIWYHQYMKKLVYFNDLAENYIAQRDHDKSAEFLRSWSMKYIMGIQRNNESCKLFVDRWNSSKLKSIFDLWVQKTTEQQLQDGDDDAFTLDPNSSMISNLSPLSKKYYASLGGMTPSLFTPIKEHSPNKINTPANSQETSPSKLQETAQRLKTERINRLRERYRNAKANSPPRNSIFNVQSLTPTKVQEAANNINNNTKTTNSSGMFGKDFNTSFIRLSPPKIRGKGSEVYNKLIERESSPPAKEPVTTLRRITPITFPLNDDLGSPRFSPLVKINSRLTTTE